MTGYGRFWLICGQILQLIPLLVKDNNTSAGQNRAERPLLPESVSCIAQYTAERLNNRC